MILSSLDPVARHSSTAGLLVDLPDTVVVSYDLLTGPAGRRLARRVTDQTGIVDNQLIDLDHDCLSCTVRDDINPALATITDLERWRTVAVALPLTTAPAPIARQIGYGIAAGDLPGVRLGPVVSAIDVDAVQHDILGDDLLDERGLAHGDHDRRSVGEAACSMIEYADAVMTIGTGSRRSLALLQHLIAPSATLHSGLHQVDWPGLITTRHDPGTAGERTDPLRVRPYRFGTGDGVWTLDLQSTRPFHPQRLMDQLADLGSGAIRGRGHFWLPSRPESICHWDGCGGQLSIGDRGPWSDHPRQTRLVITGVDDQDRRRIDETFARVLMTEREMRHLDQWTGADDGFEPWLGSTASAA